MFHFVVLKHQSIQFLVQESKDDKKDEPKTSFFLNNAGEVIRREGKTSLKLK